MDFDYAAKLTALNAVSLAGMAWAPPPPADVAIEGAVSPDTTLKWTRPPAAQAPNLAGYKVYWRLTTEPQWTHGVYVGDVTTHTLENVVIDNYFFGVAAVAKDGTESPVVFPGAAGASAATDRRACPRDFRPPGSFAWRQRFGFTVAEPAGGFVLVDEHAGVEACVLGVQFAEFDRVQPARLHVRDAHVLQGRPRHRTHQHLPVVRAQRRTAQFVDEQDRAGRARTSRSTLVQ